MPSQPRRFTFNPQHNNRNVITRTINHIEYDTYVEIPTSAWMYAAQMEIEQTNNSVIRMIGEDGTKTPLELKAEVKFNLADATFLKSANPKKSKEILPETPTKPSTERSPVR